MNAEAVVTALTPPDCPCCGGYGSIERGYMLPITCDACMGSGFGPPTELQALFLAAVAVLGVVTTVAPFYFWLS